MGRFVAVRLQREREMMDLNRRARAKRGRVIPVTSLVQIGRALIGLRIASGMNQRQLAKRLKVSENQVSRDKRNEYHGITIDWAQHILSVLNAKMKHPLEFRPHPAEHKAA